MDYRNVLFLAVISLLLFSTAFAQKTVNDFQVDESYNDTYDGTYTSVYLNENQDAGITVYKYAVGDDLNDILNDVYEDLVHGDGRDYLTASDEIKIVKNPDNTVNFTDYDKNQHGVSELVNSDGEDFIVVFWSKGTDNVDNADLMFQLTEFNKCNNVKAIEF